LSAAEKVHNPKDEGEGYAEQKACDDGKIEAAVPALVGDIPGKAPKPKGKLRARNKENASDYEDDADGK
jgi:hypothetical protein